MCGIAGILAYGDKAPPVDQEELLRIREHMAARGPDGAGIWISDDRRIGMAHRRLAIIDLTEAGAQPMRDAHGSLCVTFNGEIYNYRELRRELEGKGFAFRTESDTEVLLHLYRDCGAEMVNRLRGMFAFAIWDGDRHALFLARDAFGIKPLYYSDDGSTFRFASQVKALMAGGRVADVPDPAGHVGFFLLGSVPEPFTTIRDIHALSAGSTVWVDGKGRRPAVRFFDVGEKIREAQRQPQGTDADERIERLRVALQESVKRHLVADVPVGVFLSSGIDSSAITSFASAAASNVRALTLGFREFEGTLDDETRLAQEVARSFSVAHESRWIRQEDFVASLDHILESMDQPSIDGVNTYFVAKVARDAGMKVAMSGIGGDELFGSYPSFRDVPLIHRAALWSRRVPSLGRALRRLAAPVLSRMVSPKFAGVLEYGNTFGGAYLLRRGLFMPWELPQRLIDPAFVDEGLERLELLDRLNRESRGIRSPHAAVATLEHTWYMRNQLLRDADWAGMAHSLEIRVPLVDVDLFDAIAPMLTSDEPPTKANLVQAIGRPLPEAVVQRPKTGFSVPVAKWMLRIGGVGSGERGLRGWAKRVNSTPLRRFRALAMVTDAFGGHGGIAKFNRDLLTAISDIPYCERVVAVPRLINDDVLDDIPEKVEFLATAANSKLRYLRTILGVLASGGRFDIVICGHINLLPLASLSAWWKRCPTLLVIHGIDAWQPTRSAVVNVLSGKVDGVLAVSGVTLERYVAWSKIGHDRCRVLPNCVDLSKFGPGPKAPDLVDQLGLSGKTVLLTVGRLSELERYKGFDEVLEVLPLLARFRPEIVYLVAGEGPDLPRLREKATALGVADRVRFLGFVPESRKPDYFRLADAYVMPSRGEGFGIVFLEALACGVPVMGSSADGSREALLGGELGVLVDPSSQTEIIEGIRSALRTPKGVPKGLGHFSWEAYRRRVEGLMLDTIAVSG